MTNLEPDRLTEILDGLQARLEGGLRGNRSAVTHPGARGEASEEDWLRVLNDHLPRRYGLFTILRAHVPVVDEAYVADCARRMVAQLRNNQLLAPGWSNSIGGRKRVDRSLLAESWNPPYAKLGFDPAAEDPPFLKPAVNELCKSDGLG